MIMIRSTTVAEYVLNGEVTPVGMDTVLFTWPLRPGTLLLGVQK
jgi:hypothetical protein